MDYSGPATKKSPFWRARSRFHIEFFKFETSISYCITRVHRGANVLLYTAAVYLNMERFGIVLRDSGCRQVLAAHSRNVDSRFAQCRLCDFASKSEQGLSLQSIAIWA